jgi:hypothetical protein
MSHHDNYFEGGQGGTAGTSGLAGYAGATNNGDGDGNADEGVEGKLPEKITEVVDEGGERGVVLPEPNEDTGTSGTGAPEEGEVVVTFPLVPDDRSDENAPDPEKEAEEGGEEGGGENTDQASTYSASTSKGRKNNKEVYDEVKGLTRPDILPFITDVDTKGFDQEGYDSIDKLESVGIYKTIDLISEGPIAGFCDRRGDLIHLSNRADLNENMGKGIYFNDVPVKNSKGESYNYQRVRTEIKYGTGDQGVMGHGASKAISFSCSSQTFNTNLKLAGLNRRQFNETAAGTSSGTKTYAAKFYLPAANILVNDNSPTYKGNPFYDKYQTPNDAMSISGPTWVLYGTDANRASIYADRTGTNEKMVERLDRALDSSYSPIVFHHTVTNDNVTDVDIAMYVDQLYMRYANPKSTSGKVPFNNSAFFGIRIGYEDDRRLLGDDGSVFYVFVPITGVATSRYARSYVLPLPVPMHGKDRRITIAAIHEEPHPYAVAMGGNFRVCGVGNITEIVNAPLIYPHSAIVGNIVDARAFSRIPKRTYDVKLVKMGLPVNYDPESREYSGNWTGQFARFKKWSNNPAWVFYDMLTSKRYGLAKHGVGSQIVDKWNLYSIAKYCDELVETGFTPRKAPLIFTIDSNSAMVKIDDSAEPSLGFEKLKEMFPSGERVSFYKLKDGDGADITRGYQRRIGSRSYDDVTKEFQFSIHKIINPEFIFERFYGLRQAWINYNANPGVPHQLTEREWIVKYLTDNRGVPLSQKSAFLKEYSLGFSLGTQVRSGSAVSETGLIKPVLEPRFAANVYLDREQDAYNCLNDLAAIFRGMVYWNNGSVFISNDQAREAVMVFTNANVKEGVFTYTGSAKTTRFTSVVVRYNDQNDNFKPKVAYIEDSAGLREYGFLEKKIVALGTTSQGQAYRLGQWFLYTNQLETDLVQFKAGIESTYLRPGDVIKIQDSLKTTKRYGGRIKSIDPTNFQLTLDKGIEENIVGQKITLVVPRPSTTVSALNKEADAKVRDKDGSGITTAEIDATRSAQIKQFTVSAMGASDSAGGVQNDLITVTSAEGFDSVGVGTIWSAQNTSSSLKIKEVEYRVLSVTEETSGEYGIIAMMYAGSKFAAIDRGKNIIATQQCEPQLNVEAPDSPYISVEGIPCEGEAGDVNDAGKKEGDVKDDGSDDGGVHSGDDATDTEGELNQTRPVTVTFDGIVERVNEWNEGLGGLDSDLARAHFVLEWRVRFYADGERIKEVIVGGTAGRYKASADFPADAMELVWELDYQMNYGTWIREGSYRVAADGGEP